MSRKRPTIHMGTSENPSDKVASQTDSYKRRAKVKVLSPFIAIIVLLVVSLSIRSLSNSKSEIAVSPSIPKDNETSVPSTKASPPDSKSPSNTFVLPAEKPSPIKNDNYLNSVVQVRVYSSSGECGQGSGTAVIDGLHVLTNVHVIESRSECRVRKIEIWRSKSTEEVPFLDFSAEVVAQDSEVDLALLQLSPISSSTTPLSPVRINKNTKIGESLTIVGYPAIGGESITLSVGIIAGYSKIDNVTWIKTDATISGGSSGGGAFNRLGELVAVPTMASQSTDGQVVDCRNISDTNQDGLINDEDSCIPIGGFVNLLSPIEAASKLTDKTL